jgi:hypothetical protein
VREHLARTDDARALVRQIFETEADLIPDLNANTLTVRLHHLTQAAHDRAVEQLVAELNATQTVFPGTHLTLNGYRPQVTVDTRQEDYRREDRVRLVGELTDVFAQVEVSD